MPTPKNPLVPEVTKRMAEIARLESELKFSEALSVAVRLQQYCDGFLGEMVRKMTDTAQAVALFQAIEENGGELLS
jgi:hypothetical protein